MGRAPAGALAHWYEVYPSVNISCHSISTGNKGNVLKLPSVHPAQRGAVIIHHRHEPADNKGVLYEDLRLHACTATPATLSGRTERPTWTASPTGEADSEGAHNARPSLNNNKDCTVGTGTGCLKHSFWSPSVGKKAGVAILADPYGAFTDVTPVFEQRWTPHFMAVQGQIYGQRLIVMNVYAPHRVHQREAFFRQLANLDFPHSVLVTMGGDFDCTLDDIADRSYRRRRHAHDSPALRALIAAWGLADPVACTRPHQWRQGELRRHYGDTHTYHYSVAGHGDASSRLDRRYVNANLHRWVTRWEVVDPAVHCDHHGAKIHLIQPDNPIRVNKSAKVYPPPSYAAEAVRARTPQLLADFHGRITKAGVTAENPRDGDTPAARLRRAIAELSSGIRQGCPLAPLLFILALDALYREIDRHLELEGVTLRSASGEVEVRVAGFPGDTAVYLTSPDQVQTLLDGTSDFGAASGLQVLITPRPWSSRSMLKALSLPDAVCMQEASHMGRYLGIYVGSRRDADHTWAVADRQLCARLHMTSQKTTTVDERCMIASAIIIPKLTYIGQHAWPSTSTANTFARKIKNYVWHGRFATEVLGARAWLDADLIALPRTAGGLAVPDLRVDLMAMAAVTVSNWAATSSFRDQIVGDILFSTASPRTPPAVYITPNAGSTPRNGFGRSTTMCATGRMLVTAMGRAADYAA
ncbi:hypothetical protein ON010_g3407 [Phytophthora cinnamomi]|nr:hypothetical protein ON010_g3407 [Phytophthora cinnamomi]